MITGSSETSRDSGTSVGSGAAAQLVHCDRPLGVAAVVENDNPALAQYRVSSPVPLIRLMMQQSGCFQVVDRGQAMKNILEERSLEHSGELRQGSNYGGGQIVAADFSVTPSVVFSQSNSRGYSTGLGILGGVAGAFIPCAGLLGAAGLASDMSFSEAQTTLAVVDDRDGLQLAMAEGSASRRDMASVVGLFGTYTTTDADKVIAAGFLDAYNKMVAALESAGYGTLPQHASGTDK